MKSLFKYFLMALFLPGCIAIKINGYNSGYNKLSPQLKARVAVLDSATEIRTLALSDTIYQINASQLKGFLNQEDSVLVYYWSPHCPSETCYSIGAVQEVSLRKGYTLLVICDYFDFAVVDGQRLDQLQFPLLAIHGSYYGTDVCYKYKKRFKADLFNRNVDDLTDSELYSRYQLFSRGQFVRSISDPVKGA